jgi:hypothetical protein
MKYVVDGESLTAIADAIRDKTGKTDDLTLAQMPTELAKLTDEMQAEIWDLQEEKRYYKDEVENLNEYIETLEARIEELEGGGGGDDQPALTGIYTPDGTFSNRVYTWDEFAAMDLEETEDFGYDASTRELVAYGYDVVVPDTVTALNYFGCNNIVLPKTTVAIGYTDALYGTLYIKATIPPILGSGAFDDVMYSGNLDIVCEIGCGDSYKYETGWCDYAEHTREGEMPI